MEWSWEIWFVGGVVYVLLIVSILRMLRFAA